MAGVRPRVIQVHPAALELRGIRAERAVFTARSGRDKYFVASDHLESSLYRAFAPSDLFDILALNGLHFDQTRQIGVVFHMMSSLGTKGRMGLTAVADSPAAAQELYERTVACLAAEARRVLVAEPLPGE